MTGTAKVMTYEDIVEAEKRRAVKAQAGPSLKRKERSQSRKNGYSADREKDNAEFEIRESGLQSFCSVMQF